MGELVDVRREGSIARVVMHRNGLNAIAEDLMVELASAFNELGEDPTVRVVVLASDYEKYFSVGADLGMLGSIDRTSPEAADQVGAFMKRMNDHFSAIERCPKPVIAAINGHCVGGGLEFFGHRRAAHQSVVRVQSDAEFFLIKNLEWMLCQGRRSPGVNITQQANLQWNAFVENVLRQIAQIHRLAIHHRDVIDQPRSVPNAMRSTILNRLPYRFFSIAFARMNRNIEVLALDVMKGIDVLLRRITTFFARKIEAHHTACAEIDSQFGHLQRGIHVAHCAND